MKRLEELTEEELIDRSSELRTVGVILTIITAIAGYVGNVFVFFINGII
jgi:hypothetical protein